MRTAIGCVLVLLAVLLNGADKLFRASGYKAMRATSGKQISFGPVAELGPQLSPDGRTLAFEYFHEERSNLPQIWVMPLSSGFGSARPLVDNANYNAEFSWSPDGEWLCYFSSSLVDGVRTSQIYKVKVSDGTTQQITKFEKGRPLSDSTSWSSGGLIAFENDYDIYAVNASGGDAMRLVEVKSRIPSLSPSEIRWSPDGLRLAFTGKEGESGSGRSRIWIAKVKERSIIPVTDSKWDGAPSWLDNNHLLFSRGSSRKETKICLLTLDTRGVECLTKGNIDLSPWGNARAGNLFFARARSRPAGKNSAAFFAGFHIWRYRLVN